MVKALFNRDTAKDKIIGGLPGIVYTDSITLTVGMTLYDNTGTDTTLTIGTINQDGSFDIGTSSNTLYGMTLGEQLYIFADTSTPGDGDLAYDENGDVISGAYFMNSSYIHYEGVSTPYENLSSMLYFNPGVDDYWVFDLTSTGYQVTPSFYISRYYDEDNPSDEMFLEKDYFLGELGVDNFSNLMERIDGSAYSGSFSIHPAIKALLVSYDVGDSDVEATSYVNCFNSAEELQSVPKFIQPVDYTSSTSATLNNDW